jgi:hypothetical protein
MAGEIQIQATTGQALWALIVSEFGTVWNGSALVATVTLSDAEWTSALIEMTEEETSEATGTGLYLADWPALTTPGTYSVMFFSGASPAPGTLVFGMQSNAMVIVEENTAKDGFINDRQAQSLTLAAAAGKLSGAATTSVVIKGADNTTTRIASTVDQPGNRSAVTLSPPT